MKIDIIGSVASGKTTLAGKISQKYNVPYYEKDNIVWDRTRMETENGHPKNEICIFKRLSVVMIG